MGKPKDTDYLYSTARVRALERFLLTREHMERMLEAKSDEDASKVLIECGYENASITSVRQLEELLSRERHRVYNLLLSFVPHRGVVDVFRIKYDYHNLKAIIKSEARRTDAGHLMIDSGRFDPSLLLGAVHKSDYSALTKRMRDAAVEAVDLLARTSDPQLSDISLDKACYAEMLEAAAECKSDFLAAYVRLSIDAANLKTIVRSERTGRSSDFLRRALIEGGNIGIDRLTAFSSDMPLEKIFVRTPLERAASYGDELLSSSGGASLSDLDSLCDAALSAHLGKAHMVPFGEAPVIAYMAAKEEEYAAIRTILSGRLSGVPADYIRRRLPSASVVKV